MNDPLSPSAQAVLDAIDGIGRPQWIAEAALRAVADQSENFYDPHEGKVSAIRTDWILAIAAELEQ